MTQKRKDSENALFISSRFCIALWYAHPPNVIKHKDPTSRQKTDSNTFSKTHAYAKVSSAKCNKMQWSSIATKTTFLKRAAKHSKTYNYTKVASAKCNKTNGSSITTKTAFQNRSAKHILMRRPSSPNAIKQMDPASRQKRRFKHIQQNTYFCEGRSRHMQ